LQHQPKTLTHYEEIVAETESNKSSIGYFLTNGFVAASIGVAIGVMSTLGILHYSTNQSSDKSAPPPDNRPNSPSYDYNHINSSNADISP